VVASLVLLALMGALPVVLLVASGRLYRWWTGPRARRAVRPRAGAGPRRPIEQVAADLRRLYRQLELVPAATPGARNRALLAAYDHVLAEAAALLDLPEALGSTPEGWDRDGERLRVEARLAGAGLRVRD
jgi:hypothetical protein